MTCAAIVFATYYQSLAVKASNISAQVSYAVAYEYIQYHCFLIPWPNDV